MLKNLLAAIFVGVLLGGVSAQQAAECKDDIKAGIVGTISKVEEGERLSDGGTQWEIWLQTIAPGDCYVSVITSTNRPPDDCKKGANVVASGVTSHMIVPELEASVVICWP